MLLGKKVLNFLAMTSQLKAHQNLWRRTVNSLLILVESMGGITLRTSLLDRSVQLSPHCAPETLSRDFCSCVDIGDRIDVLLQGCPVSNYCGFHLRDADVLSLRL